MNCYRIKNWIDIYENNRTRELKDLKWFPCPVKLSGDGYSMITEQKDGAAIFGAWMACMEVAASCDPRGTLLRSAGIPHDAASIARQTRLPVKIIDRMLSFCFSICNWLELIDLQTGAVISQEGAEKPPCITGITDIEGITKKGRQRMHDFINSPFYGFDKFKEELKDWPEEKIKKYYEAAKDYSLSKGVQYKNWIAAVRTWERKVNENKITPEKQIQQDLEEIERINNEKRR
jgi:hypothetical protein